MFEIVDQVECHRRNIRHCNSLRLSHLVNLTFKTVSTAICDSKLCRAPASNLEQNLERDRSRREGPAAEHRSKIGKL
jgi:hypothetical protein